MDLRDPAEHFPWVPYEAQVWLDTCLPSDLDVFEWGSGSSTLYFANRARRVVSIEHNPEWYAEVRAALTDQYLDQVAYRLVPPRHCRLARYLPYSARTYVSRTFAADRDGTFRAYARAILDYADATFDLVLVDGRARAACLRLAPHKLKPGGLLVLDNSERPHYEPAMRALRKYPRLDFFGRGPRLVEPWQTTIWRIEK
ncbi:MAG: class I SAM-dependent methyltransferase [Candidatus Marinimicrobia bacterium]|nr:class I SAM-dependent methyltransferase [Candidatus Neomarinimicrobiota bacterium]